MRNPFHHIRQLDQKIFLCIIGLELLKTLIIPNPIDILILIGMVIVFIGCYADDCHWW